MTNLKYNDWLKQAAESLQGVSDSPLLDARLLLCHVLDISKTTLLAWPEREIPQSSLHALSATLDRRKSGEPVFLVYRSAGAAEDAFEVVNLDFADTNAIGVSHFALSADGETVFYAADVESASRFGIYSAELADPGATQLIVVAPVDGFSILDSSTNFTTTPPFIVLQ